MQRANEKRQETAEPRRTRFATTSATPVDGRDALLEAQLHPPRSRPGLVERLGLVDLLVAGSDRPLVVLSAPVGYGKSTLLAEWARRDGRTFAWVSLGPGDGDPVALFTLIGHAVGRALGVDPAVFNAETPGISVIGQVVPRLIAALQAAASPLVIVINNLHEVRDKDSRDALNLLVDHLPPGAQLAVSSRQPVWLATSARRASGQVLELGPGDLAFSADEVARLLEVVAGTVGPDDVAQIVAATEGWPAGVYLSALALRRHGSKPAGLVLPVAAATTVDVTAQFIRDEVLSELHPDVVRFLRRVAVLEVMSGPLCDAVLHTDGSDRVLQSISRSNLLVVPIDASGSWYRCHMLLRTALLDELANQEHDLVPVLHARASAWWEAAGSIDPAVRHALAAGDTPRAAELAAGAIIPAYYSGRLHVVETWLAEIGDAGIDANPTLAVLAGWIAALTGRSADAARWLDRVDSIETAGAPPPGVPSFESNRATLRGFLCAHGVDEMAADAELAASLEPAVEPLADDRPGRPRDRTVDAGRPRPGAGSPTPRAST